MILHSVLLRSTLTSMVREKHPLYKHENLKNELIHIYPEYFIL